MEYNYKIGVDPSTKNCGYAILRDDKVIGIGRVDYEGEIQKGLANKLCTSKIDYVAANIGQIIKNDMLNTLKSKTREQQIEVFNKHTHIVVAMENGKISGKNRNVAHMLAIFAGAQMKRISTMLNLIFAGQVPGINYKFISPNEWANVILEKTPYEKREQLKERSILEAKKYVIEHGKTAFKSIEWNDDMADALHIARVADTARDIQVASFEFHQRPKRAIKLRKRLEQVKGQIAIISVKAQQAKQKRIARAKISKKPKYSSEEIKEWPLTDFLTKQLRERLDRYNKDRIYCEKELDKIRKFSLKHPN